MRRIRLITRTTALVVTGATTASAVAQAPPVRADYGPGAEVASAAGTRLGSGPSRTPALSADGRYVVFDTDAPELLGTPAAGERHTGGIVRRDTLTGAVTLVAPPRRVTTIDGTQVSPGATGAAAISADARHVLFRTSLALVPGDRNTAHDAYLRDMSRDYTDAAAYTLVSALDGTDDAPRYGAPDFAVGLGRAAFSLSADGRTAVFWTNRTSNLPAGGEITTPRLQVFVRSLDDRRTTLVTRDRLSGGPVARDAAEVLTPAPALSADGSAVAWVDPDSGAQVPLATGEAAPAAAYLWRDLRGDAPARRVSGGADLDDPACSPGTAVNLADPQATGPCYATFFADGASSGTDPSTTAVSDLSISADGRRVLFLSGAQRRPLDEATARTSSSLYLADMTPGLPRKHGVPRILSLTTPGAAITEATLSPDGRHVVLTTANSTFDGARVIGALPTARANTTNVWLLDTGTATIQRVTVGHDGSDYRGTGTDPDDPNLLNDPAPAGPVLTPGATAVAFAAGAGNLFVGDANGVPDVHVARGAPGIGTATAGGAATLPPEVTQSRVALPRVTPLPAVHPVIGYPVVGRDGIARIKVRVPAAGRVRWHASAQRRRFGTGRRAVRRASTVTLKLAPSQAVRRARRHRAVRVAVSISYLPAKGSSTRATRRYTIPRRADR